MRIRELITTGAPGAFSSRKCTGLLMSSFKKSLIIFPLRAGIAPEFQLVDAVAQCGGIFIFFGCNSLLKFLLQIRQLPVQNTKFIAFAGRLFANM